MKIIKKTERGICPFCGSSSINYYETDTDENADGSLLVRRDCRCIDCKSHFVEFERSVYDGFAIDIDDEYYDFDAECNEIAPKYDKIDVEENEEDIE